MKKRFLLLWLATIEILTLTAATQTALTVFVLTGADLISTTTYMEGSILFRAKVIGVYVLFIYSVGFKALFTLWWYWLSVGVIGILAWYAKD